MISDFLPFWLPKHKNCKKKWFSLTQALKYPSRQERRESPVHMVDLQTWPSRLEWGKGRKGRNRQKLSFSTKSVCLRKGKKNQQRKQLWTIKKQHINRCKMFLFKWNAHMSAKETNFVFPLRERLQKNQVHHRDKKYPELVVCTLLPQEDNGSRASLNSTCSPCLLLYHHVTEAWGTLSLLPATRLWGGNLLVE